MNKKSKAKCQIIKFPEIMNNVNQYSIFDYAEMIKPDIVKIQKLKLCIMFQKARIIELKEKNKELTRQLGNITIKSDIESTGNSEIKR